ncbi:MFS transporter [Microbacterium sp. X-17]|uniref:MFS transporter n=1 Tax=Microbacterium sp. X-17 TaxID=3144404 RepID=UPI0031F52251
MSDTPTSRAASEQLTPAVGGEPIEGGIPVGQALEGSTAAAAAIDVETPSLPRKRVGRSYITLVTFAAFGGYLALVTPIALSLSLKVEELAPGHPEILGYITGIGAIAALLATPIIGMFSDRTRSRLGRRRPYLIAGTILGLIALAGLAIAPNLIVLGIAWVLTQLGWGAMVLPGIIYSQADKVPEEQRGKVSGLVGFVQNLGPIVGAGLASAFIGKDLLVFLVPGVIGAITIALFVIFVKDDPNPSLVNTEKLRLSTFFGNLVFNPRKHVDFAWNCLGRVIFNLGLSFSTTFTTFFFAARMGVTVSQIGGIIVILSIGGVLTGSLGALGGGWLSDKLKRRRLLVMVSAVLFTAGVLIMAFSTALPLLITGSLITSIAVGAFASVDQAIVLDILPERDTDAGRYIGINNYATMLPQAIGPLIASVILVIGVTGADKNYGLLFIVAAICTLIGGSIILAKVRGTR